jgi:hypothetical protein
MPKSVGKDPVATTKLKTRIFFRGRVTATRSCGLPTFISCGKHKSRIFTACFAHGTLLPKTFSILASQLVGRR